MRLLVASPIHQQPAVLEAFLGALAAIEYRTPDGASLSVEYLFVDDNTDPRSKVLIHRFSQGVGSPRALVLAGTDLGAGEQSGYARTEGGHFWDRGAIGRVAAFRERILRHARDSGADAVFLVDSDLVLQPQTLVYLIKSGKDIISEVFWTAWTPGAVEMPNVWEVDHSGLDSAFLAGLRRPGVYRVGGLGACTLISRAAILAGVSYKSLYNLSWWGEDRHFCVRAVALGLDLWADSHCPPLHLYRNSDLQRLPEWRRAHFVPSLE